MSESLEEILGIQFHDPALLRMALTHRSFIYEGRGIGQPSNERLEFLGDSILAFIATEYLYRTFPALTEGELTDIRAMLIRTETLAAFSRDIQLDSFLRMGKGERRSEVGKRVLAAAFEALLGALFLDQGLAAVQDFLLPRLESLTDSIVATKLFKDNKSLFQEQAQAHTGITPVYRLVNQEGPSHDRKFTAEVMLGDEVAGTGYGRNKQAAEQEAAHEGLVRRGWIE